MADADSAESSAPRAATIWSRLRSPYTLVGLHLMAISTTWGLAWANGWKLVGDDAFIMMRADDVFSSNTPLRGMPSSFNAWSTAADPFHPGPVPFWVFAPATWLFGPTEAASLVTTWVLVAAATVTCVWIAVALGGSRAGMWAAAVVTWHHGSLAYRTLWSPLTPIQGAVGLLTLCFITWAIAAGRPRWWPCWIVVASFTVQTELSFGATVAALGTLVVFLTVKRTRAREHESEPLSRATIALTATLGAALWAPVVIDALSNGGGNVGELWRAAAADLPAAGWRRSLYAVWYSVSAGWGASGSITIAGVTFAAAMLILLARRLPGVRFQSHPAVLVASTALLATCVVQGFTPSVAGLQPLYLLPVAASGIFLVFTVVTLPPPDDRFNRLRWGAPLTIVALTVISAGSLISAGHDARDTYLGHLFPAVQPIQQQLTSDLPPGRYAWRPLVWPDVASLAAGVGLEAQRSGIETRVEANLAKFYGPYRLIDGTEQAALYFTYGDSPPVPGAQLVARWVKPGSTDRGEAARRASALVRKGPIRFTLRSSPFFVATVIAGTAGLKPDEGVWTDSALGRLGRRYWDKPSTIAQLPDRTIATLLEQGLIESPSGWSAPPGGLGTQDVVTVWKVH